MERFLLSFFVFIFIFPLSGCQDNFAPVREAQYQRELSRGIHVVRPGETLYAIAWLYNRDYRELAARNHISPPYSLRVGQRISLYTSVFQPHSKKIFNKTIYKPISGSKSFLPLSKVKGWIFPTRGVVVARFSLPHQRKGIDIAGKVGQPVLATAGGEVAYSGSGIRGYGNLLIIKHNETYLSAYAHNQRILVKEGQRVKAGQVVARMGTVNGRQGLLHFEIRLAGKPVDPLSLVRR